MSWFARRGVLIADALFLLLAGAGGLASDLAGTFWGLGPVAGVLGTSRAAGIGLIEAHGLALIIAVMLAVASRRPTPRQHAAALAAHLLLGASNLVFWDLLFVTHGMLAVGWITTVLHIAFVMLQLLALAGRNPGLPQHQVLTGR